MKALEKAGYEFKKENEDGECVLYQKYAKVGNEFLTDKQRKLLEIDEKYYGDADLQGVYKTKKTPDHYNYEVKSEIETESERSKLNRKIGHKEIQHGANDNYWVKEYHNEDNVLMKKLIPLDQVPDEFKNRPKDMSEEDHLTKIKKSGMKIGRDPGKDEYYVVIEKDINGNVSKSMIKGTVDLKEFYKQKGIPWPPYKVPPYL